MLRVVVYLAIVAALGFGAAWLAERPGEVVLTWQGHRIETSVMVLIAAAAALAAAAVVLWSLLRAVARSPEQISRYLRERRGERGFQALSQGLIAVGSGDVRAARKFTQRASRLAPDAPLTLLLCAQTAQLSGDSIAAAQNFQSMARREDTKLLGLHGLFVEARRRNDGAAAQLYAEEAARQDPAPAWAAQAVLELRSIAGDWAGALDRLDRNHKSGLVEKPAFQRQRAVLLTAQALAVEPSDREQAKALALQAVRLAPTLVPAAALAGRLLARNGEWRKAARIIETAWRASPHPDLAQAYAHLRPGDSARERLTRIERLEARSPGHAEAALALARAALDAREFAQAREALAPLTADPTRRVAVLMAELEQQQHGDEGRAREWMARAINARRDPAWTADGFVCEHWLPVSPITGKLDAFEWKDPLEGVEGPLIEAEQRAWLAASEAERTRPARLEAVPPQGAASEAFRQPFTNEPEVAASSARESDSAASAQPPPQAHHSELHPGEAEPAFADPAAHAPDDPGPQQEPPSQAEKPAEPAPAPAPWSLRQLFRS